MDKQEPIIVKMNSYPQMQVELFLRVKGRLPTEENDIVDKALAKEYLDMWFAKKLTKYDNNTKRYAFHIYGGGKP